MAMEDRISFTWTDWAADRAARGLIGALMLLPYRTRVAVMGWLMRRVIGPVLGYRRRALANLAYIWPELDRERARAIADQVLNNVGRTVIENYSTADQLANAARWQPGGPGFALAEAARAEGRPIVFVSGHFGNYQVARAAMNVRGYQMGGLYRPMNNGYFNRHYIRTIEGVGGPAFARGRKGNAGFLRHIRKGGQGALLIDQFFRRGTVLDFLGKPAPTVLTAAEIALRYNALLMPIYARRLENGIDFEVTVEAPIAIGSPEEMTQALNNSLAAQVRDHPGQWFWVHRRWKPERQAAYDLGPVWSADDEDDDTFSESDRARREEAI